VIAHVDADAFYASVHLLEDPSLRGKPVIVAGTGPRSIVTTASYEARAYGIGSAQPAARARQLCPHGIFLAPDFTLYRDYSQRAMSIIRETSAVVEPLSLDEAYLDMSEVERPIAAVRAMVERIEAEIGLRYSVGIGPNKLCAKVLSDLRKPAAFNVASREQCCELFAERPPRTIPGIGPKTADVLDALGLTTIRAVRDADELQLRERFGERRARELQARARFEHDGRVEASRERKSISEERTFDVDIEDPAEMEERLRRLSEELGGKMHDKAIAGRTVSIKVRLADFTTVTRARTLPARTNDANLIADTACALLAEYAPPQPIRLIGVGVSKFEDDARAERADKNIAAGQLPLFT
jgi:DNA polymerase-4